MSSYKVISTTVGAFCFIMADYMTVKQILQYTKNNDVSTIGFEKFNESPKDVYPTFTLCFEDNFEVGKLFDAQRLNETAGITPKEYSDILLGKDEQELSNPFESRSRTMKDVLSIDFEDATVGIQELFSQFMATGNKHSEVRTQYFVKTGEYGPLKLAFYTSYQDPTNICYKSIEIHLSNPI